MNTEYVLIADGACSGNPGRGGWGLIVKSPDGHVREFGGMEDSTTNNRMELFGLYRGLQEVYRNAARDAQNPPRTAPPLVHVISDSKYVLEGAEKSLPRWSRNGWVTTAGEPVKNRDLWEKIEKGLSLLKDAGFAFRFELVKGHAGTEANERVDQIAVKFSQGLQPELYQGPIDAYPVSLNPGTKFEPVYLSLVAGKLERHSTWEQCKRATDGKNGAKYKKVKNRLEEEETLRAWGLGPSRSGGNLL
jgi:ribonuclease HI